MNQSADSDAVWHPRLDEQAVAELWQRFGARLRQIARRYLGAARPVVDSEDIASQAFTSLIRKFQEPNELSRPWDSGAGAAAIRDEMEYGLWPVALGIARNKSREANRNATAGKRGGSQVRESADAEIPDDQGESPYELVCVQEQLEILGKYVANDSTLGEIVRLRLAGHSSNAIAVTVGLSEASICRRLKEVRRVLEEAQLA